MPIVGTGQLSLLDLNDAIVAGTAPTNPTTGDLWIDTSVTPSILKKWSGSAWVVQTLDIELLDPDALGTDELTKKVGIELISQAYLSDTTKSPVITSSGAHTIAPASDLSYTDNKNMIRAVGSTMLRSDLIPFIPDNPYYISGSVYNQTTTTGTFYIGIEYYDKNKVSLGTNELTLYAFQSASLVINTMTPFSGYVRTDASRNIAGYIRLRILTRWNPAPVDATGVTYIKGVSVKQLGGDVGGIIQKLSDFADDSKLTQGERGDIKDTFLKITGTTIGDTSTLPTAATLDAGLVGEFYSIRKQAINAGILSTDATYVALATQYSALKTYLDALSPKPWDVGATTTTNIVAATWRTNWNNYYTAYNNLAVLIADKLQSSIGTRNFMPNSSADYDYDGDNIPDGWTAFGAITGTPTLGAGRLTGSSIKAVCNAVAQGVSTPQTPVTSDTEMTISGWMLADTACTLGWVLKFRDAADIESNPMAQISKVVIANTWTFFEQTFTVPSTAVSCYTTPRIIAATGIAPATPVTMWVDDIKLENGNKATDWTPSIEDVNDATDGKINIKYDKITTEYSSAIQLATNTITLSVDEKITSSETGMKSYVGTQVQTTSNSFNVKFTEVEAITDSHESQLSEVNSYFKFNPDGLNIGKSDSPLQINISNAQMDFIDNGAIVAYVNGQKMYIDSLEVLTSLVVGNHKIEKYDNNITVVKWVGE